jgi:hypothetical protein
LLPILIWRHEEVPVEKGQTLILQGSAWFRGAKLHHGPTVKMGMIQVIEVIEDTLSALCSVATIN